MKFVSKRLLMAAFLLGLAQSAFAQTADEVVEKYLAAVGGRATLAKLKSRTMAGTISLTTPAGDITGSIEVTSQEPNKSRTLINIDLSAFGAGQVVQDQRFDGTSGFAIDTLQGNRDITGNQLANLKNSVFPNPFVNYKEVGATVELSGKEEVGQRDAYVVLFKPKSGSAIRQFIDAETYLPIKMMLKVEVPQIGQEIEQTTEFSDYREVDGVKVPFQVRASSAIQSFTVNITKVQHNLQIDQSLFSKPGAAVGK